MFIGGMGLVESTCTCTCPCTGPCTFQFHGLLTNRETGSGRAVTHKVMLGMLILGYPRGMVVGTGWPLGPLDLDGSPGRGRGSAADAQ